MSYNYKQSSDKSFGQIILGHYEKILEIARHELRPSERILLLQDSKQVVENEDTRYSYMLSIENLGYALEPYFDEKMQDYFEENIIFLSGFGFEIIKKIKNDELMKRLNSSDASAEEKKDLLIGYQVQRAKLMFRELGHLMKRVDYLKASVFGDESSDEIVEDDDEDE